MENFDRLEDAWSNPPWNCSLGVPSLPPYHQLEDPLSIFPLLTGSLISLSTTAAAWRRRRHHRDGQAARHANLFPLAACWSDSRRGSSIGYCPIFVAAHLFILLRALSLENFCWSTAWRALGFMGGWPLYQWKKSNQMPGSRENMGFYSVWWASLRIKERESGGITFCVLYNPL